MELYLLAKKNSQENLCEECVVFLSHNLNNNNVCKVNKFAYQENIRSLQIWCLKIFKDKLSIEDLAELIGPFEEHDKAPRIVAFSLVLLHFFKIHQKKKHAQVYESFLLKNIEMDTLPNLAHFLNYYEKLPENVKNNLKIENPRRKNRYFIYDEYGYPIIPDEGEGESDEYIEYEDSPEDEPIVEEEVVVSKTKTFEERIIQLKEATFRFIQKNVKDILASESSEDFLIDFTFGALFMSQIESNVSFKIEGKVIPAHKRVLMKKSRYFEKMFNSGMAESKQDVIDIQDCEYDVFQGKMRLDEFI